MNQKNIEQENKNDYSIESIQQNTILFVEGKIACKFIHKFLEKNELNQKVQISNYGSHEELESKLKVISKLPNFKEKVTTLAILADVEYDKTYSGRIDSYKKQIKACEFYIESLSQEFSNCQFADIDRRIGIYLFPNNKEQGMMETLLYSSIEDQNIKNCIENYFECSNAEITNKDKARVASFLSIKYPQKPELWTSFDKNIWDFEHEKFNGLKKFLKDSI